jgi:hypothetical protein
MPSGNNLGSWDGALRDMRQKRAAWDSAAIMHNHAILIALIFSWFAAPYWPGNPDEARLLCQLTNNYAYRPRPQFGYERSC